SFTVVNSGSCISSIPRIGLSAQGHEHDISNAPPAKPVYTVPKFNSLLGLSPDYVDSPVDNPPDPHASG
ncbi:MULTISPECIES: hypothetical protein, partial [Burkholderia]